MSSLKVKYLKRIYCTYTNQKKAGMAISLSNKVELANNVLEIKKKLEIARLYVE